MKKLIIAAFALTTAAGVFAQGTVSFQNRISSPAGTTHIWGPSSTTPTLSLIGLGSNDGPTPGTTPYAASGMSMIGASGLTGKYGASTTFAQLIGAAGSDQAEASLVPVGQISTFRTGGAAGNIALVTVTLSGSPSIPSEAPYATFEIVAWDNSSGSYATWTEASAAWAAGTIAAGRSTPFNVSAIGSGPPNGGLITAPNLNNMEALTSFNLYFQGATIPEPSSFALAGLGAAALLIFRRRK